MGGKVGESRCDMLPKIEKATMYRLKRNGLKRKVCRLKRNGGSNFHELVQIGYNLLQETFKILTNKSFTNVLNLM